MSDPIAEMLNEQDGIIDSSEYESFAKQIRQQIGRELLAELHEIHLMNCEQVIRKVCNWR